MSRRLLLSLALWASCSPGHAGTGQRMERGQDDEGEQIPIVHSTRGRRQPGTHGNLPPKQQNKCGMLGVATLQQSQPCLQSTPEATWCTIPHVHLFSTVPYVLNVTALHPSGASSSLLAFVAERIIKPDPPEGVRLRAAGQLLQVLWHPPVSWPFPDIFSLKYRVRYRRHGTSHFRQVGPIEATTFTFRAAKSYAKYCVQVSAQDLTDYGKPSDWSLPGQAEGTPQKSLKRD